MILEREIFDLNTPDFETRRLNFTFRYVPREHVQKLSRFPKLQQEDLHPYIQNLSLRSDFFKELLLHMNP